MPIDKSISLKILADIKDYQAEMSKIPGYTEKAAAAASVRMEKVLVKDLSNKLKATGKAGASAGADIGKSMGQAKEQVSLLAEGLNRINPELGAMASNAGSALGIIKAMASPVGAIGAAVASAAGAWVYFSSKVKEAEERQLQASQTAIKAQLGIIDSSYYVTEALEKNEQASLLRRKGLWIDFARDYAEIWTIGGLNPVANAAIDKLNDWQSNLADQVKAAEEARDRNIELAQAAMDHAKSIKEQEAAQRGANAATSEAIEYDAEFIKQQEIKAEMLREQREEREALAAAAAAQAKADAEAATLEAQRVEELTAARQKASEQAIAAAEKEREIREANNAVLMQGSMDAVANSAQLLGALFDDSKGAAMAIATVQAAQATISALANPPGPPFTIPAAIAAAAAGAAQIATIKSTEIAHSGLSFTRGSSAGPDESDIRITRPERVLTARGAAAIGGDAGVAAANAGRMQSGAGTGVTFRWKHKYYDDTLGDNFRRDGSARKQIRDISTRGKVTGHRNG